jgi:hypothetical protein
MFVGHQEPDMMFESRATFPMINPTNDPTNTPPASINAKPTGSTPT